MKTSLLLGTVIVGTLLIALAGAAQPLMPSADAPSSAINSTHVAAPHAPAAPAIIIDHTTTDITKIPDYWLGEAKKLYLHYAHTSHGGQILEGMYWLYGQDARYDFYHLLALPDHPPTELPTVCQAGQLCIYDGQPGYDGQPYEDYITPELYWATEDGITRTRIVADTGLYDLSMWSWCSQQSDNPTETVQLYLGTMANLEAQYPSMRFILMTGHTDGGGTDLDRNNDMVRQYARDHGMVLFDFADIETYDPLGGGPYLNDSEGTCTWCEDFCAAHPEYCASLPDTCTHSDSLPQAQLFCKLKAHAFWWMMARLAGWSGPGESHKAASTNTPIQGQIVTYTILVQNLAAPMTASVHLTDIVPSGLAYVPGTLSATGGAWSDAGAPALTWSGVLSPTPVVTVSYAVTVTATAPAVISNMATIVAPGYQTLTRTATIIANGHTVYLPVVMRH